MLAIRKQKTNSIRHAIEYLDVANCLNFERGIELNKSRIYTILSSVNLEYSVMGTAHQYYEAASPHYTLSSDWPGELRHLCIIFLRQSVLLVERDQPRIFNSRCTINRPLQ